MSTAAEHFVVPDDLVAAVARANHRPRGPYRLFGPTVARFRDGQVFLMNGAEGGWSRFAYPYRDLDALVSEWSVMLGAILRDRHSTYVIVHPYREPGA